MIIFLLLFFGFSLEDMIWLSKYGSISCNEDDYVYLDLSDFGKGDTIYLEVYFYSNNYIDRPFLPYIESNSLYVSLLNSLFFSTKYSYDYEHTHDSNSR